MLKPKDINEKTFARAVRGYNADEVDDFFDMVTEDFSTLYRENAELHNKIDALTERLNTYKSMEDGLRTAKEKIYKMAQDMAAKAKTEADRIEREAQERADRIVFEARRDCENQKRVNERLTLEASRFKAKTIALLKNEIELLNNLPDVVLEPKDELRICASELREEDPLSSPFIKEYKEAYKSPEKIDFGVPEEYEENSTYVQPAVDSENDFATDYLGKPHTFGGVQTEPEPIDEPITEPVTESTADTTRETVKDTAEAETDEVAETIGEYITEVEEEKDVELLTEEEIEPGVSLNDGEQVFEQNQITDSDAESEPMHAFAVHRVDMDIDNNTDMDNTGNLAIAAAVESMLADNAPSDDDPKTQEIDTAAVTTTALETGHKAAEHPKFGELRFGTDYDIDNEADEGKSFSFFRKKK